MMPAIHKILAADHISETSYAQVFQLLYSQPTVEQDAQVAFCAGTKEWKMGRKTITDVRMFQLLGDVCDVIRCYVLASWDACIFSAWVSDKEVAKVQRQMEEMETLAHVKAIFKLAAEKMVYNSDGTIDWGASDTGPAEEP